MRRRSPFIPLLLAGILLTVQVVLAVDVKVGSEKGFDFAAAATWGWHAEGPGQLRMARTADDDPDFMKAQAEPIIVDAVTTEMAKRGRQFAADRPHLLVRYFLLLSVGTTAQEVGQFLPATAQWGLPYFPPATQSLEMMNRGSLVLDVSSGQQLVWRGVAQAGISFGADRARREKLLREAVRDLLKKFPERR